MTLIYTILAIAALITLLEILWILVPFFFHIVLAPRMDGTYVYSPNDFLSDQVTPKKPTLSKQDNNYAFIFDEEIPEYRINFGDDRCLTGGKIRLFSNGTWYSSSPESGEQKISLKEVTSKCTGEPVIHGIKGDTCRVSAEWTLAGDSLFLVTHFDIYHDCKIMVSEPDLLFNKEIIADLNFILFTIEFPDGLPNCSTGEFEQLAVNFPGFTNQSPNIRMLTFKESIIAPPSRDAAATSAPRLFFDEALNTHLVCAVDEFMIHLSTADQTSLACGLNGEVEQIPPGYTSRYLLLFDRGINRTFERFGDLLRAIHGKCRKSMYMDVALSHLGYWTDNGGYYYYNPIKGKKLSETLVEVNDHIKEISLPVRYYNIDSWWYQKSVSAFKRRLMGWFGRIVGGGLFGGALRYEPDPHHMHFSVKELSSALGAPIVAHHRWFNADTPYQEDHPFTVEHNRQGFLTRLIRGYDDKAVCIDRGLWDRLMEECIESNMLVWEQDWLHPQFKSFKMLRNQTGNADQWLVGMGKAAKDHGITILYALSSPGMNLTSIKLDSVSQVRTAQDYHPRWPRSYDFKPFAQTNIFAYALRLWPFKDVFRSTCEGPINGEAMPEFMALVSTLSCGPVGVGDRIGRFGVDTIMRTCRIDGLLLKPDKPLTAADRMFLPHHKYFLSSTHSEISGLQWNYVLINHLNLRQPRDKTISINDIGIRGKRVAYNYYKGKFHLLDSENPFNYHIKRRDFDYWIAAPFLKDGFAVIGDISKYTTMSFKEFLSLEVAEDHVDIQIESIAGETVQLLMYDEARIRSITVNDIPVENTNFNLLDDPSIPEVGGKVYIDQKNNATLLVLDIDRDGVKRISICVGE